VWFSFSLLPLFWFAQQFSITEEKPVDKFEIEEIANRKKTLDRRLKEAGIPEAAEPASSAAAASSPVRFQKPFSKADKARQAKQLEEALRKHER
jgi:hypothetical protein